MSRKYAMGAVALFAAVALSTGCSVMAVKRAPTTLDANEYPECTEKSAGVVVDTVLGIIFIAAGLLGLATTNPEGTGDDNGGAVTSLLIGGAFAGSTFYGMHHTKRCRTLREDHDPDAPSVDITKNHDDSAIVDRKTERGQADQPCYDNNTCNQGFFCDPAGDRCRPGNRGLLGGLCFDDGTCIQSLDCELGTCIKALEAECRKHAHCKDGQMCDAGLCVMPAGPSAL